MKLDIFLIDFENVQPAGVGRLAPGTCKIKLFLGQNQTKIPVELGRALLPFGSDVEFLSISGSGPNAVDFHIAFYIGHLASLHPGARFSIVSADTGFDPLVRHISSTLSISCRRIRELPGDTAPKEGAPVPAKTTAVPVRAVVPETASARAAPTVPVKAMVSQPTMAKADVPKAAPAKATPSKKAKNVQVTVLPDAKAAPSTIATADVAKFTEKVIERLKGLKSAKPATLKTLKSSLTSWGLPGLDGPAVSLVLAALMDRKIVSVQGTKVSYRFK